MVVTLLIVIPSLALRLILFMVVPTLCIAVIIASIVAMLSSVSIIVLYVITVGVILLALSCILATARNGPFWFLWRAATGDNMLCHTIWIGY